MGEMMIRACTIRSEIEILTERSGAKEKMTLTLKTLFEVTGNTPDRNGTFPWAVLGHFRSLEHAIALPCHARFSLLRATTMPNAVNPQTANDVGSGTAPR